MTGQRWGIRARITGGSLLVAILVSLLAGVLITTELRRIVAAGQLDLLTSIAAPYASAISKEPTEDLDPPGPGQLILVLDDKGATQISTLGADLAAAVRSQTFEPGVPTGVRVGDDEFLVLHIVSADGAGQWSIFTAVETAPQAALLDQVIGVVVLAIVAINAAFAVASWLITTAVLAAVRRLRRGADELRRDGGDDLLPVGSAHDEIADLARTMNALIGELRASAARERQVVADASHELRTPIAILSAQLELAERHRDDPETLSDDLSAARRAVARLGTLASSLLVLSRIDAQMQPGSSTLDEVLDEVADAVDRARIRAIGRAIAIDYTDAVLPIAGTVAVAPSDLGRICDNLVANSLAVLPRTGRIDLSVDVRNTEGTPVLALAVEDDGGGMPEEVVPVALQRFSRASTERSGHDAGAGLGLPIVSALVDSAGGTLALRNRPGVGLRVEITLPITVDRGASGAVAT